MYFWRLFSKIVFWISFIGCSIGVFIYSLVLFDRDFIEGLVFLVAGAIAVLLLHTGLGMYIELCDNAEEVRVELCWLTQHIKQTASQQDNSCEYIPYTPTYNPKKAIDKLNAANNGETYSEDVWFCKACGTKNQKHSVMCKDCGKYK